jgi:hypothetical protein
MSDTINTSKREHTGRFIVPVESWHIEEIEIQPGQKWVKKFIGNPYSHILTMRDYGPCFTALSNGRVLGIGGLCKVEEHRGMIWSILASDIGSEFFFIHKEVKAFLNESKLQRIEMATETPEADRWAGMLGFEFEGTMRKYFANGSDGKLFARVK